MAGMFILMMLTFVFFRAGSVALGFDYLHHMLSVSLFSPFTITEKVNTIVAVAGIALMLAAEWLQRDKQHALQVGHINNFWMRALIYYSLILIIITFTAIKNTDFIYFRF